MEKEKEKEKEIQHLLNEVEIPIKMVFMSNSSHKSQLGSLNINQENETVEQEVKTPNEQTESLSTSHVVVVLEDSIEQLKIQNKEMRMTLEEDMTKENLKETNEWNSLLINKFQELKRAMKIIEIENNELKIKMSEILDEKNEPKIVFEKKIEEQHMKLNDDNKLGIEKMAKIGSSKIENMDEAHSQEVLGSISSMVDLGTLHESHLKELNEIQKSENTLDTNLLLSNFFKLEEEFPKEYIKELEPLKDKLFTIIGQKYLTNKNLQFNTMLMEKLEETLKQQESFSEEIALLKKTNKELESEIQVLRKENALLKEASPPLFLNHLDTSDRRNSIDSIRSLVNYELRRRSQVFDRKLHLSMNNQQQGQLREDWAATMIQAVFRGYYTRELYKKIIIRKYVASEILDTEISYIKNVSIIRQEYINPLRDKITSGNTILTKDQIDTIFFQIEPIIAFNSALLTKIRQRMKTWFCHQLLADIFVEAFNDLGRYTMYIMNYNRALATLRECDDNALFRNFMTETKSKQARKALSLKDLLIMPIQRIPRYLLLLQELSKCTEKSHPDYNSIEEAIILLRSVVHIINEKKRELDMFEAVVDLEERISNLPAKYIPLARSSRYLVMQGDLSEKSFKEIGKEKPRYAFLFSDSLLCVKSSQQKIFNNSKNANYEFKWIAPLYKCQLELLEDTGKDGEEIVSESGRKLTEGFAITWISNKVEETHILYLSNESERRRWIDAMNEIRQSFGELDGVWNNLRKEPLCCKRSGTSKSRNKFAFEEKEKEVDKNDLQRSRFFEIWDRNGSRSTVSDKDIDELIKMTKDKIADLEKDVNVETKIRQGFELMSKVYESGTKKLGSKALQEMTQNEQKLINLKKDLKVYQSQLEDYQQLSIDIKSQESNLNPTTHSQLSPFASSASGPSDINENEESFVLSTERTSWSDLFRSNSVNNTRRNKDEKSKEHSSFFSNIRRVHTLPSTVQRIANVFSVNSAVNSNSNNNVNNLISSSVALSNSRDTKSSALMPHKNG